MTSDSTVVPDRDKAVTVGSLLKGFRKASGLTQQKCAEVIGVSQPTLQRWEQDRRIPTPCHLDRLLLFYKVTRNDWVRVKRAYAGEDPDGQHDKPSDLGS